MVKDGKPAEHLKQRYAGWDSKLGKDILSGKQSLADLAALVDKKGLDPQPRSGRQEWLEALINHYI